LGPNELQKTLGKRKCSLGKEVRTVGEEEIRKVPSGNVKRVGGLGR
jgi:hypothetical protein